MLRAILYVCNMPIFLYFFLYFREKNICIVLPKCCAAYSVLLTATFLTAQKHEVLFAAMMLVVKKKFFLRQDKKGV